MGVFIVPDASQKIPWVASKIAVLGWVPFGSAQGALAVPFGSAQGALAVGRWRSLRLRSGSARRLSGAEASGAEASGAEASGAEASGVPKTRGGTPTNCRPSGSICRPAFYLAAARVSGSSALGSRDSAP